MSRRPGCAEIEIARCERPRFQRSVGQGRHVRRHIGSGAGARTGGGADGDIIVDDRGMLSDTCRSRFIGKLEAMMRGIENFLAVAAAHAAVVRREQVRVQLEHGFAVRAAGCQRHIEVPFGLTAYSWKMALF
jgi:hypothetical protein